MSAVDQHAPHSGMAVNEPAPDFELYDLLGAVHRLGELRGRIVLINFWSAECPWSEQADQEIMQAMSGWGEGVVWWSVAANANEPLELVRRAAEERRLPVVLVDAKGDVAGVYEAQTTPHCFVVDRDGILRYRGAVNDRTFRKRTAERFYVRDAIRALLEGGAPDPAETQPYGCAIVRYGYIP